MSDPTPLILAVAPNGARKTKADHPALPIAPGEIAEDARACRDAGAAMLHLHVRDAAGGHSLDVELYRAAIDAVRKAVGPDFIVQVTSEAVGRYDRHAQMAMVRALKPEAVSLALRELAPDDADVGDFAAFLAWMRGEAIAPQIILYDAADTRRLRRLCEEGALPIERPSVLFVLGRYSRDLQSAPADMLPFLNAAEGWEAVWSVCAFGARETACALTAAGLGGHARVGFENNTALPDGAQAPSNAALIGEVAAGAARMGRRPAGPSEARAILGMPT